MGFFKFSDRAPSAAFTSERRTDRTTDELIGICRGVLADGLVNSTEANFISGWIERNAGLVDTHPFGLLLERLHDALKDGVVDEHEESDLLDTLSRFVGGEAIGEHGSESASRATALPLDDPQPSQLELAATFVVTGTFQFGSRAVVASKIVEKGGTVLQNVSKKVRYLVIGEIGSRDWIHSSYGRKIEYACELRSQGVPLQIISEGHWTRFALCC